MKSDNAAFDLEAAVRERLLLGEGVGMSLPTRFLELRRHVDPASVGFV
jgi:hypothetical protein